MALKIAKYCRQPMLYWEKLASSTAGKPVYSVNPVSMLVRWSDEMVEVITPQGRTVMSNSNIMAATEMKVGSIVFLGTVADWRKLPTYPARPSPVQGGREIILTGHIPDRKGRDLLFQARV